ncbi:MAG: hypothetical protein ACI9P5_003443 [Saprospiraceae bacterium]|jgi:hypothetical protein
MLIADTYTTTNVTYRTKLIKDTTKIGRNERNNSICFRSFLSLLAERILQTQPQHVFVVITDFYISC